MPIRLRPRMRTDGKSWSASAFAFIIGRITGLKLGSSDFITSSAQLEGLKEIEIWGDGEQTRSFCYIDDCVTGLHKLMRSDYREPLNLGQDRMVSINQLADMIANIAGARITKTHVPGPQGVRGRNSDNTRLKQVLGWEPQISLEEGLRRTYLWIKKQVIELASEFSFGIATFPPLPRTKEQQSPSAKNPSQP